MSIEKVAPESNVEKEISSYVRNLLWYIMEQQREHYNELHCFDLGIVTNKDGQAMQKAIHTYWIQVHQHEYLFPSENPIKNNVAIKVDNSGTATMMLSDELESNRNELK